MKSNIRVINPSSKKPNKMWSENISIATSWLIKSVIKKQKTKWKSPHRENKISKIFRTNLRKNRKKSIEAKCGKDKNNHYIGLRIKILHNSKAMICTFWEIGKNLSLMPILKIHLWHLSISKIEGIKSLGIMNFSSLRLIMHLRLQKRRRCWLKSRNKKDKVENKSSMLKIQ